MPFFRMRLILALIVGITLVSVGSTYFDVLAHKHVLRRELERNSTWLAASLQPQVEQAVASGKVDVIEEAVGRLHQADATLGLAVFAPGGRLLAAAGPDAVVKALAPEAVEKAIRKGAAVSVYGHSGDWEWLEDALPLRDSGQLNGVLVILEDSRFIRAESDAVWQRSFWRIVAFVVLIVAVTLVMVRWFLMRPMARAAERLRQLRMGRGGEIADSSIEELSIFTPLAREMETMAESLMEARAAAEAEARLRDQGEHIWTADRLAVHVRERFGSEPDFCGFESRAVHAHSPGQRNGVRGAAERAGDGR